MKTISCIIPTCDRGDLLLEAVASAAGQTRPPNEIVVVNNGNGVLELPPSTSGYELVKVYNIVAYAGVSQARNFGAAVATGDYLAFLDDDDMWHEQYLEHAARAIERGERFIVGRLDEVDETGVRPYKNADGDLNIRTVLVRNPGANGSNIVVERQLFRDLGGFDSRLPASTDKSFVLEALLRKVPVATQPEMQVLLRSHAGARITSSSTKMAEGIWQFTRKYGRYMTTEELLWNVEKAYRHRKNAQRASTDVDEKRKLVLRMLRGESPEAVARESSVPVDELTKWKQIGDRVARLALMDAFAEQVQIDD